MSESAPKTCVACGTAVPVEAGLAPEMAPAKCPACQESGRLSEAEAIAKITLMGEEMHRDVDDPIYFYAQRIGMFTLVLSVCGLAILLAYAMMSKGDFSPILGIILLVSVGMAGGLAAYWARKSSRPDDPFKDL